MTEQWRDLVVPPRPPAPPPGLITDAAPGRERAAQPPTTPHPSVRQPGAAKPSGVEPAVVPSVTAPPPPAARPAPAAAPPSAVRVSAPPRPTRYIARTILTIYVIALALIAFWPVPVDRDAGAAIRFVTRIFPILTHARIEFGANILLFVPLGILLALILTRRYLLMPIAFVTTVAIESVQALMLERRTPSVMDIVANVAGACLGLLVVALVEWWRRRAD